MEIPDDRIDLVRLAIERLAAASEAGPCERCRAVIFMHTDATDMRKSFTGLCGIIRGVFGDDPADGSLFLFVDKPRATGSSVRWEGDGFVIWYKRLEQEPSRSAGHGPKKRVCGSTPRSWR